MRRFRGGTARSSYEVPDKRMEQRRCIKEPDSMSQPVDGRSPMKKAKPFCISKKEVWEAYAARRRSQSTARQSVSALRIRPWMAANYAQVPFERYADDVIVHCRTEKEAKEVRTAIAERLRDCGLELHPAKTKIVYCKDG